jgi:peptidyl-prolyl cis-trans isomerase B (cyclophilin B)
MNAVSAVLTLIFALVPLKPYVRPDQPVDIRFVQAQPTESSAKVIAALGPCTAAKVPDLFSPAAANDLIDQSGLPDFALYTLDGKAVEATAVHQMDLTKGVVDVAAFYPQIRKPGTWILTWKSAQPLVIESLANPVPYGFLEHVPPEQKAAAARSFAAKDASIIHLVSLTYALISTEKGDIKATFAYDMAPHTVDNFVALAKGHFYDGSTFHRIMKGFMIQGGDSFTDDRAGSGGPGYQINAELSDKPHDRGVLSMARAGYSVDSAGSQFFIIHQKSAFLDHGYSAFGQVSEGMDIVDKIAETPNNGENGSVALKDRPVIKSIQILPATAEMYGIKK